MGGIGSFQKETRTLFVSDLALPLGKNPVETMNESYEDISVYEGGLKI